MSLADDAATFLQGEVGKVLAIPATLQDAQGEVKAVVARAADATTVARAQALQSTLTQLQARYGVVYGTVSALAPKLNQSAIAAMSFDQALSVAGQLASVTGDVVSLLNDTTDAANQAHALYYGTPGVAGVGVPTWAWVAGVIGAGWWFLKPRRGR